MRAVAAPHSAPKVRLLELGARGWVWGSLEGAALGPQPQDLRANKCLPASRAVAPAAGGPLLPETRGGPRPCPDPDSPRGARTQSDPAALQARRPRDSTSGWILHQSAAVVLSRLSCPGDPTQSGQLSPESHRGQQSCVPHSHHLPHAPQDPFRTKSRLGGADANPHPARSIQT